MASLHYVEGDVFELLDVIVGHDGGFVFLPHVVNSEGKMGAGFVVPLCRRYPIVKEQYLRWHNSGLTVQMDDLAKSSYRELPWKLGNIQLVPVEERFVVCNMLAQQGFASSNNARPLRYNALAKCMDEVVKAIKEKQAIAQEVQIVSCLFGAGLSGGNWTFIEELIIDCWLPYVPVTICYLPNSLPKDWQVPSDKNV